MLRYSTSTVPHPIVCGASLVGRPSDGDEERWWCMSEIRSGGADCLRSQGRNPNLEITERQNIIQATELPGVKLYVK